MRRGLLHCLAALVACSFDASGQPTTGHGGLASESSGATTAADTQSETTAVHGSAGNSMGDADVTSNAASSEGGAGSSSSGAAASSSSSSSDGGADESSSGGPPSVCGNGVIEVGESCETNDLGTAACSDVDGVHVGDPSCAGCQVDYGPCCVADGTLCVPIGNDCCSSCGLDFVCG